MSPKGSQLCSLWGFPVRQASTERLGENSAPRLRLGQRLSKPLQCVGTKLESQRNPAASPHPSEEPICWARFSQVESDGGGGSHLFVLYLSTNVTFRNCTTQPSPRRLAHPELPGHHNGCHRSLRAGEVKSPGQTQAWAGDRIQQHGGARQWGTPSSTRLARLGSGQGRGKRASGSRAADRSSLGSLEAGAWPARGCCLVGFQRQVITRKLLRSFAAQEGSGPHPLSGACSLPRGVFPFVLQALPTVQVTTRVAQRPQGASRPLHACICTVQSVLTRPGFAFLELLLRVPVETHEKTDARETGAEGEGREVDARRNRGRGQAGFRATDLQPPLPASPTHPLVHSTGSKALSGWAMRSSSAEGCASIHA